MVVRAYYSVYNMAVKPIIYIYPEEEMKVSVKVGYPDKLTHTYPKYQDEWKVIAKPDCICVNDVKQTFIKKAMDIGREQRPLKKRVA